ncbi:coilin [Calliphora vicina]|uniref:coilin n=1 Tax=Calliphora vicina TaxID=7373 RepID=UPI00325C0893
MNKKAIKIDLSTFFDDERKMTCVLVDPNWKSVACLQKRVEFLFDVDSVRFLSDGYFLPPQESIEIIKFCNDLKAFVPKESLEKRKKKKSKKCKNIEKSSEESGDEETSLKAQQQIEDSQIKRKYNSLANTNPSCTLTNKAKRSKNYNTFSEITSTSEPPIVSPLQVLDEEVKTKKSKTKKSKVSIVPSMHEESMVEIETCESKSEVTVTEQSADVKETSTDHKNADKKRLTSTPKDKKTFEFEENGVEKTFSDGTKATTARHSSIPSSTFLNESKLLEERNNVNTLTSTPNPNNPFKTPKSTKARIYFRCPLSELTNDIKTQKPRIFNLKSKNIENYATKKPVLEIQEQIILPPIILKTDPQSPSEEKTEVNEIEIQQKTIETTEITEETDSLNEKSSLNNTSNVTGSTTIAQNVAESSNETTNVIKSQTESQMQETSIMSVDCVDLSIDIEDEDNEVQKKNVQEKLDLTVDGDVNDSSSDIEEISDIIDLNETDDNCNTTVNTSTAHSNSINDIQIHKILPFSTELKDMPTIGDIVIFKIPFFNEKKQLVYTNHMAGKVEYINRRTKSIKFLVIDGDTELRHMPSQFICNLDDSRDNTKYVQLKLNEMHKPKLFSRA